VVQRLRRFQRRDERLYSIAEVFQVKHDVKARLTLSSSGGEGARTHIQVLANSAVASVLILLHYWQVRRAAANQECWPYGQDLLVVGIIRYLDPALS
jgi:hypothetical protein